VTAKPFLNSLEVLLRLLLASGTMGDYKDFRKLAIKLKKTATPQVQMTIIDTILAENKYPLAKKNLLAHVDHYIEVLVKTSGCRDVWQYFELLEVADQLGKDGYQGLILHEDVVYPIELFVESKEDRDWGIENEDIVALTCIDGLMSKLGLKRIECAIALFTSKGFKGALTVFETERTPMTDKSVKIGDSNFFYDKEE
jgi:hypothetical protein